MKETSRYFSARWFLSINSVSYGALADLCKEIGQIFIRRFSWRFTRKFRKLRNTFIQKEILEMRRLYRIYLKNASKCKMLAWRQRSNLWDRYVQNINNVNDKISNSEEEETSITMSIVKLDGGTGESHGGTRQPGVFIFNFAVANFAMESELELMSAYIIWEMVVISVSWKEFQKNDGACRQDTHVTIHICAVQFVHNRGTRLLK